MVRRMHPPYLAFVRSLIVTAALFLLTHANTEQAAAQDVAGKWQASALKVSYKINSWGPDCGMKPRGGTENGGSVSVTRSGDHLNFSGAVRGSTSSCWSDTPGLKRAASSAGATRWTTTCKSPKNAAHPETGRYTFSLLGDQITFRDSTSYRWTIKSSTCDAVRTASRTFSKQTGTSTRSTCVAGPVKEVRVSSTQLSIPEGGRKCISARVVDAKGCTVKNAKVLMQVQSGAYRIERSRCVRAQPGADRGAVVVAHGEFKKTIRLKRGKGGRDFSDLAAVDFDSDDSPSTIGKAGGQGGGGALAVNTVSNIPWWIWMILCGLAVLAAAVVFTKRKGKQTPIIHEDNEQLRRASSSDRPKGAQLICPKCRRGYAPHMSTCEKDGAELIPYADFLSQNKKEVGPQLTCPTCGQSYPQGTTFCVKDGSKLSS